MLMLVPNGAELNLSKTADLLGFFWHPVVSGV